MDLVWLRAWCIQAVDPPRSMVHPRASLILGGGGGRGGGLVVAGLMYFFRGANF